MNASALRASSRMLHRMRGGSRDTDANELMVIPSHLPSVATVVTRQTPVGNVPRDCLNERASVVTGVSPVMSVHEYIDLQYWPLGVRPSRCCPTIEETASQLSVMWRTMAFESRHIRCMG